MVFRLTDVKIGIDQDRNLLAEIAKRISIPANEIEEYTIIRKAVDARKKDRIVFVYSVDLRLSKKAEQILSRRKVTGLTKRDPDAQYILQPGQEYMEDRPVIVGAGPAGIFAALTLAKYGFKPIVLERGNDVDTRTRDVHEFWSTGTLNLESNVQFGEGGAGTFSDGKLTTRINDPRIRYVLEEFVKAGAPEEILYLGKPHIGTDVLKGVVKNIRLQVQDMGGDILFGSKVTSLLIENSRIIGVVVNDETELYTRNVIVAIGHSARDTYEMLHLKGINLEPKAFSVGVRIEHPQKLIDEAQYGSSAGHPALGAADYQLVYKNQAMDRAAYSFCMCPGGKVVAAASEKNSVVTNGMSDFARDSGVANSALVVSVRPEDFDKGPLSGIAFQRKLEKNAYVAGGGNYHAPAQYVGDFLKGKPSSTIEGKGYPTYEPGVHGTDLHECLPGYVTQMLEEALTDFNRRIQGFAMSQAVMTGVETRTSAPVRIQRGEDKQSTDIKGLYPAGEGAGYAGGIMSAAVDGIKVAETIIERYRREE